MSLYLYLFQLRAEQIAVMAVLHLGRYMHLIFSLFRIRLWRTGPVCACTP